MGNNVALMDLAAIRVAVNSRVEVERGEFQNSGDQEIFGHFSTQEILKALNSNEDGDAWLFKKLHRGRFVYDHAEGRWYLFQGHSWAEDILDEVTQGVQGVIDAYGQCVLRESNQRLLAEKAKKEEKADAHGKNEAALLKRIRLLQTVARKANVVSLAKSGRESLGIAGTEWNPNPMSLAVKNGNINLQSVVVRDGRPEDYSRTVCPVEWKGIDEPAPLFEKTILKIFDGDLVMVCFVQRVLGYGLTGLTVEHIFIILWGIGRNGKGLLLELLAFILGDYAGPIEAEMILKQRMSKHSGGPTSDIMALRGKRIVWSSETEDGRKLNAGKLKWLTGGDSLTGRGMYAKHQVSFRPTHTFFLLTNHKPHANADDYSLWERIFLIPFPLSFVDHPTKFNERKVDKNLLEKLKAESSGILAWLVRGCLAWQREGLNPPDSVRAATKAYRAEEDLISKFIESECVLGPEQKVTAGVLYGTYRAWAETMGLTPISGVRFGKEIASRFESEPGRNKFYIGLNLYHRAG